MAQIWMDDENAVAHMLPRSARKAMGDNALQQSAKKSVLSKLDNMLYNKPHLTPFKGANAKFPASCAPKISLCKETLQKQHRKLPQKSDAPQLLETHFKAPQSTPNVANDLYAKSAEATNDFDLFDFMDFPSAKCLKNCQKPLTYKNFEPLLNEELIAKLLNNTMEMDEELLVETPSHPDLETDDIAWQPITYKSTEFEEPLKDIFDLPLPANFYFADFEREP